MAAADYRIATQAGQQEILDAIEGEGGTNEKLNVLAKDETLALLAKDATMSSLLTQIVEVLASVKSVNGKYGVVVLDSGDILISKSAVGSKTVAQVLSELAAAVAATPLTFTAQQISGDDYKIIVTTGTPS